MWKGILLMIWRIFQMKITPSFLRKRRMKSLNAKGMLKIEFWDLKGLTSGVPQPFPRFNEDLNVCLRTSGNCG